MAAFQVGGRLGYCYELVIGREQSLGDLCVINDAKMHYDDMVMGELVLG